MAVDPAFTPVLPARLVVVCYKLPHYLRPSFDVIVHFLFSFSKGGTGFSCPSSAKNIQIFESNSQHNTMLFYNRLKSPRYTRLQPLNIAVGEHV
jgi:hypothetical protein